MKLLQIAFSFFLSFSSCNGRMLESKVCFPTLNEIGSSKPVSLVGWYDNCNDEPVIVGENGVDVEDNRTCSTNLRTTIEAVPLDTTGETCYVNPIFDSPLDVFWFGPHVDPETETLTEQVALYFIGFSTRANDTSAIDTYMPQDCNSQGVCSCTSVEPLRSSDWGKAGLDPRHWCDELTVSGVTSCGSRLFEEAVMDMNNPSNPTEQCQVFGQRFTFQSDNTTRQMFCDLNWQLDFGTPLLPCPETKTPQTGSAESSGYSIIALPALVGAMLACFI